MKKIFRYLGAVIITVIIIIFVWEIPSFIINYQLDKSLSYKDLILLENEYRKLFLQILGGIVVLYGLYLTFRRIKALENNVLIASESQITERFSKAIEHLGNNKIEIRLGGIYALERIARDSLKDHFSIMEILTAFIRENDILKDKEKLRPSKSKTQKEQIEELLDFRTIKPRVDIEAILTVIGRRNWIEEEKSNKFTLDLGMTNLEGAYMANGNYENTLFWKTNLKNANLSNSNFSGSLLMRANLEGSFVYRTNFTDSNLRNANLLNCVNLTVEQLLNAKTLYMANLNENLKEDLEEKNPKLLQDDEV